MMKKNKNIYFLFLVFFMSFLVSKVNATTFSLSKFLPVKNIKLHSIKDRYSLSIPIPKRWKVKEAVLKFSYVNSSALLAYKSKLIVAIDEIPLQQVTLDPINYENSVTVKIPGRLLKPGYHDLNFIVSQHSEKECEDPFAPELWTVLKLAEAKLSIDYEELSIPLKLSSIPKYIEDPKSFPTKKINIILPVIDKEFLKLAGLVSSGIGARLKYRSLNISLSQDIRKGVDNIFIGSKTAFKSIEPKWSLPKGACIGINHLPLFKEDEEYSENVTKRDERFALIAITGETFQEIEQAVLAFSAINYPFPADQVASITDVKSAKYGRYVKKDILTPGLPVKFKDLGFSTHVFKGLNQEPVSLDFYLPSDLYIKPNEYAVLALHFAFSGAIRKDSTVKIELNGKPVSSIHLENEHGAMYENYKILIPTYLFKPGKNVITFQAVLVPLIIRRCEGFHDMNLFLTMFDDSIIRFPDMAHWGKLPAIEYFFDSGFPFSRMGDGSEYAIVLMQKDYSTSTLALNLLAYLGQITGIVPTEFKIAFDVKEAKGRDIILIGSIDNLPENLIKLAPLKLLTPDAIVEYPQINDLTKATNRTWCEKIEERLRGYARLFPIAPETKKTLVKERHVSIDNEDGLIMEFESPFDKGRSILVWTAKNSNAFLDISKLLWIGKIRSSAKGDLVLFSLDNNKQDEIYSLKLGPDYYTGKLTKFDKVDFYLRSYTWLFYCLLAASIVCLAFIFAIYLKRRKKKRLAHEE